MRPLPPFLRTRRARRIGIALAVLLVLRIALPYAIAAGIGWAGPRYVGVPISVANVDLGVLRGRIVFDGLAVAGPGHAPTPEGDIDPATALLRWDRLDLNFEWLELLRGRLRLSDLSLAAPTARVELDAEGSPILPEPPSETAAAGATEAEAEGPAEVAEESTPQTDATAPATETPAPASGAPESAAKSEAPEKKGGGWPILVDRLALSGLDVRLVDDEPTPAVSVGLEGLQLEDVRFDQDGLGLGAIGFEAPTLSVRRDFVFAEPGKKTAPASESQTAPQDEAPQPASTATYRMKTLRIDRAEFTVLTTAGPLHAAIELDASGVTTEPGVRFPLTLALEIEQGRIDVEGQVGVVPPAFTGSVRWSDLPLAPLVNVARPDLARWVASQRAEGDLAIDLRLQPEQDHAAGLTVRGRVASNDLLFRDPDADDLAVGWKRFEIPIDEVDVPLGDDAASKPVRVALGAVKLEGPHASYRQPNDALEKLLGPEAAPEGAADEAAKAKAPAEPASAASGPEAPAPVVTVASVEVSGGDLGYRDDSVRPAYSGRVRDLAISLRDVRLPEATVGNLALSARLPVRSKLSIRGQHGARRSDVHLNLERLALPPLNPYAVGAAGYRVKEGQANLETEAKRNGERWDVTNQLVIGDLALSPTGSGKLDQFLGIPVSLAIALLRDLQGNIKLGIPVTLDRGKLRVGIGAVVRDALRDAVAGAVTSPLKMMGAAMSFGGGGGLSVEPIAMRPGTTVLADEDQASHLSALAELIESRPVLAVRLTGLADPTDRDGLAERILIERIADGRGLPDVEDSGFFARRRVRGALEARGRGEPGELGADDEALLARYRAAVEVPPERFTALARERAQAVAARLTGELSLPPEHVRVADETETGSPGVRIGFEAL